MCMNGIVEGDLVLVPPYANRGDVAQRQGGSCHTKDNPFVAARHFPYYAGANKI